MLSKWGTDVFNLPSHSQHPTWLPKGKTKVLDAVSLWFCWEPYLSMGGGCGFSWQVSQTRYPGHSHLCPHRSQFLRSAAWLHGWGLFLPSTQESCIPWRVCPALNLYLWSHAWAGCERNVCNAFTVQHTSRRGPDVTKHLSGQARCLLLESQANKMVSQELRIQPGKQTHRRPKETQLLGPMAGTSQGIPHYVQTFLWGSGTTAGWHDVVIINVVVLIIFWVEGQSSV